MPTVLIVDDEPVIRRVLARFLEAPGRRVLTAASVAEAIAVARTGDAIDVALLDKNLGDGSGLELARDLRGLDALTAVILITGYASLESAVEAVQIGAYDYVTKPVDDFDGLALKVGNALEKVQLAREHERIVARLAESEARYRELFDAAPDALVVMDMGSSRVREANASAAAMFERERSELVGADVRELFKTPLPMPGAWPEGCIQVECVKRGGGTFPGEVRVGSGHVDRRATWMLTVRDVSVREQLLAEHRAVEAELRQAQKMDALGRLAGGIAHDLGNVLGVVLSCVEQMSSRCEAKLREDLDVVHIAVERGSKLVKQMMTLTRKGPSSPVLLSVAAAVEETTKLLRRSIGQDVSLVTEAPPDVWCVRMDPTHLSQVLLNLAVNARDAMPHGGMLRISIENCPGDARRDGGAAVVDRVVLTVSDTGVGMTPEIRERVFEPFFTTKAPGKGTGLGLAVTYGIVRQAGGSIAVDSEPGRGSTFRISFPRARDEAPPAVAERPPLEVRQQATERTILLVEDVTALRARMARVLGGIGFRVLDAGSAEDALRAVDEDGRPVDLLVTDLILPGMAGTELAQALRRAHPACPVLLVTSASGDARVEAFAERGGRVLVKPFREATLIDEVMRVVSAAS